MSAARRWKLAPRSAWTFAAAFLCLVLPTRLTTAAYWTGSAGATALVALLFVLPLLYTVPWGRAVWVRYSHWLLAAQAVATYLPLVIFGRDWVAVSLSGLLGGLLLLTLTSPVSWIAFGAVLAVEGVLRFGVLPLPGPSLPVDVLAFTVPVNTALTLYGLVRLADLVIDLQMAESELAGLAVARLRLRAASRLREAVEDRLESVTAHAGAALTALARSPGRARDELVAAAGVARQALNQIRTTVGDDDGAYSPPVTAWARNTVAPRVARLVLLVVLCAISVQVLANVVGAGAAGPAAVGMVVVVVGVVALQLYHSLARRDGVPPPGWRWTLATQALLSIASFWAYGEVSLLGMAGFTAGSALLVSPSRWGQALFVAIPASVGVVMAGYSAFGVYDVVYFVAATAATGVVVYGLSRLTDLAQQVEATRWELARAAAVHERVRVARDTHDLLGLGLSSVALKCDLAARLIGRDDARAHRELEQLVEIAASARRDVLAVTDDAQPRPSLDAELTAARDTLASTGVDVRAEVSVAHVPPAVDTVLGTVLREAITNVLRHANATQCVIELSAVVGRIRLSVTNDGVLAPTPTSGVGSAGIANLRARVEALDGCLTANRDGDGRFRLVVEIPASP